SPERTAPFLIWRRHVIHGGSRQRARLAGGEFDMSMSVAPTIFAPPSTRRRAPAPGVAFDRSCWLDHAGFSLHPPTVNGALASLDGVTQRLLQEGDPRAAFPDIYAVITRRVAERVEWGPRRFFQEPAWVSRLAGRFSERYLETLRWSLMGQKQDAG